MSSTTHTLLESSTVHTESTPIVFKDKPSTNNHFPELPPYQPPTDGFISYMPEVLHPYMQVMRLDRPKPSIYFFLPHVMGALQAASLLGSAPRELLRTLAVLALGTFFLRGATCTWNDLLDVEFDRKVARCRHRPLARGALSVQTAVLFTAAQTVCALGVLFLLPNACWIYAIPSVFGWCIYPMGKRYTDCPQFVLGLPMAWGVFMGAAAMGADPLRLDLAPLESVRSFASSHVSVEISLAALYAFVANWAWNLCYETMYSYQDAKYDQAAGVRNVALLLGVTHGKKFLTACAAIDTVCLYYTSQAMSAGPLFVLSTVLGHSSALAWMIADVKLDELSSIAWWFRDGGYITGSAMVVGAAAEYFSRII